MAQLCNHCSEPVSDDAVRCPSCGHEIDPYRTMQLPAHPFKVAGSGPSQKARPIKPRPVAGGPAPAPQAPVPQPRKLRPKPRPVPPPIGPSQSSLPPVPQNGAMPQYSHHAEPPPQPQPVAPSLPPSVAPSYAGHYPPAPPQASAPSFSQLPPIPPGQVPPPYQGYALPQGQPPSLPQPPPQPSGGLIGKFKQIFRSQPEPPPPNPGPGLYAPAAPQAPIYVPQSASTGPSWPPIPPEAIPNIYARPGSAPSHPPVPPPVEDSDESKTAYMRGADLSKINVPSVMYCLQLLDTDGNWCTWSQIGPKGLNVGRGAGTSSLPFLNSMAVRHLRLSYENRTLVAEDLGSRNGVYLKLTAPAELADGARFRVGSQVIEFHRAGPFTPVDPLVAEDGEEFLSFDLEPLAFVDLIRPDNTPGLRFPITKPDVTRLGRVPQRADIALPKAEWVSSQHAQIRHDAGRFYLEDLGSKNGTFLQIQGPAPLRSGDVLLVGRTFLRVIDQSQASGGSMM